MKPPSEAPLPFVDTSVVRKFHFSPRKYREYLKGALGERRYLNTYIKMEFKNGFLRAAIAFYLDLKSPYHLTFEDALLVWANKVNGRDVKVVLELSMRVLAALGIKGDQPEEKPRAIEALGDFIYQVAAQFEANFIDCGENPSQCHRGAIELKFKTGGSVDEALSRFLSEFKNDAACRGACQVETHLSGPGEAAMKSFSIVAATKAKTDSVNKLGKNADALLKDKIATCKSCARVGDLIIGLEAPAHMEIVTLDHSFDVIAPICGKAHRKLLSVDAHKKQEEIQAAKSVIQ